VEDPSACRDWYVEHLGFTVVYDAAWYVQLELRGEVRYGLAFLAAGHPTQPVHHRHPTRGPRFVSVQLESVDEVGELLTKAGVRVDVPLGDEAWGQRHIVIEDPGGNYVDLVAAIDPDPAFARRWLP
jgi:catechol 2,3-dioxygenase-like lactoylglutathione lyase family enzyme